MRTRGERRSAALGRGAVRRIARAKEARRAGTSSRTESGASAQRARRRSCTRFHSDRESCGAHWHCAGPIIGPCAGFACTFCRWRGRVERWNHPGVVVAFIFPRLLSGHICLFCASVGVHLVDGLREVDVDTLVMRSVVCAARTAVRRPLQTLALGRAFRSAAYSLLEFALIVFDNWQGWRPCVGGTGLGRCVAQLCTVPLTWVG